jgi:hypothetical protein
MKLTAAKSYVENILSSRILDGEAMLFIINNHILDSEDRLLKKLSCPKRVADLVLETPGGAESLCTHCERNVLNTDFFDETEIIHRLDEDLNTCLKINRYNPIFRVIE